MVVADSHLKLLPTSILDIFKVSEHFHMLSIGIGQQPYTVMAQDLGHLGDIRSQKTCVFIMVETDSHLNLLPTSTIDIYKECEQIQMLSIGTL